jgi:hypothetical protein
VSDPIKMEKFTQDLFRAGGKAVVGVEASNRNLSDIRGLVCTKLSSTRLANRVKNILHPPLIRINLIYESAHLPPRS